MSHRPNSHPRSLFRCLFLPFPGQVPRATGKPFSCLSLKQFKPCSNTARDALGTSLAARWEAGNSGSLRCSILPAALHSGDFLHPAHLSCTSALGILALLLFINSKCPSLNKSVWGESLYEKGIRQNKVMQYCKWRGCCGLELF